MSLMGTPKAPAFSQSTSTRYWVTSSRPAGRTRVNLGVLGRQPQQLIPGRHQFFVSQPGPVL